jgi:hypothetical protein
VLVGSFLSKRAFDPSFDTKIPFLSSPGAILSYFFGIFPCDSDFGIFLSNSKTFGLGLQNHIWLHVTWHTLQDCILYRHKYLHQIKTGVGA